MSEELPSPGQKVVIESGALQEILDSIRERGFTTLGPVIRDGAITYDDIESLEELPQGWTDEQNAGKYRLVKSDRESYFAYSLGPESWKKYLQAPLRQLWTASRDGAGFQVEKQNMEMVRTAFIGVRPCDLNAISILDRILSQGVYRDPSYAAVRAGIVTIAVNCGRAGGTCFCASMRSGPRASSGFDLALTEIIDGERHYFLVDVGTQNGASFLEKAPFRTAGNAEIEAADDVSSRVVREMGRHLDTGGIRDLFSRNFDNPRWELAAAPCLTCGNCTMVCPTCFCTTVEDKTDLTGKLAERRQRWDSCFTMDFSYIHGGSIRSSQKARYRQMVTHKLGSWIDQFGVSGCVGCGRCITWCPAGIDITETVRAMREGERTQMTTFSIKESEHGNA